MHTITIKYPQLGGIKTLQLYHPEKFEELTHEQFIALVNSYKNNSISIAAQIMLIPLFLGIGNAMLLKIKQHCIGLRLKHETKEQYRKLRDMAFYNDLLHLINLNSFLKKKEIVTKVFIKKIKHYYGPADKFSNVTIGEFAFADTYYINWRKTNDVKFLNQMVAVLYRQKKWAIWLHVLLNVYNGDKRVKFNEALVEKRAEKISKLPFEVKNAIAFNYGYIREYIEIMYPHVFNNSEAGKKQSGGWADIIRSLTDGDLTKLNSVANALMHNVLSEMEKSIKDSYKK